MIKQTGFLYKLRPTDYITGASPVIGVEVNNTGDWTEYLPTGEKQYKYAKFDTMSCTTFSFLNAIETSVNFLSANNKFSKEQLETLNSLGFYADGKFNCSDRFTAIMSGTMSNGNYFQNVGDSVRRDGLLAEALLGFGGNNQAEYLDKSLISEDFKNKAKQILDILDIKYEWTSVDDFKNQLKQCPIQGAIPEKATHAVMIPVYNKYFDSYEPYLKKLPVVKYAMKVIVAVKETKKTWKYFKENEVVGLKTELVDMLDKAREIAGIPFVITSGYRDVTHNEDVGGVKDSSHTKGEAVDLRARNSHEHFLITKALMDAGFTRISKCYKSHIHCDIDSIKPKEVLF